MERTHAHLARYAYVEHVIYAITCAQRQPALALARTHSHFSKVDEATPCFGDVNACDLEDYIRQSNNALPSCTPAGAQVLSLRVVFLRHVIDMLLSYLRDTQAALAVVTRTASKARCRLGGGEGGADGDSATSVAG